MVCERCGKRDAAVHLLESENGRRRNIWLCEGCAASGEGPRALDGSENLDDPEFSAEDGSEVSDEDALDRFIGQMFDGAGRVDDDEVPDCPACGTSYAQFRGTGRLGCARCYRAFRIHLLPFLGRFHRQVTHLGKFPTGEAGAASRLGEITRTRIALEKAVGQEDFEEAARLRDEIRKLEREGRDGGLS